jgi:hypothetical protein
MGVVSRAREFRRETILDSSDRELAGTTAMRCQVIGYRVSGFYFSCVASV